LSAADEILEEIEGMAKKKFLPIVEPSKGHILVDVVFSIKPKRVLEVGTLIGYSAVLIGKELEKDAHLTTIEIHKDEAKIARENIVRAGIPQRSESFQGTR
jgi:predicted O-methyltransferase YrrM